MMKIITDYSAGAVATVNDDGTPAVSPKATFVIVDNSCIAFGDIRSPGTVANIKQRPNVEVWIETSQAESKTVLALG